MMQGIDLGSSAWAADPRAGASSGLLIETCGPRDEVVKVFAPLTTPGEVLEQGLEILAGRGRAHADGRIARARLAPVARGLGPRGRPPTSLRRRPGDRLHHLFEQRCDQLPPTGTPATSRSNGTDATYGSSTAGEPARPPALGPRRQPGDRVGLLFDGSADMYASILAVSKLHAAYVPLDAGFPASGSRSSSRTPGSAWW